MTPRPPSLAAATVLVAVIGSSIALVGAFLLAIAAGGIPFLDSSGAMAVVVALLGATAVAVAVVAVTSAVALWRGRPWGWAGSFAVAVVAVLGALVALAQSGAQSPIVAGLVLTLAAAGLLLAPDTRRAVGLG